MNIKKTTLLAVMDDANGKVLMIRKLRGMKGFSDAADGMSKDLFNLPGGKVAPGESFLGCAVRETAEETGITPIDAKLVGQLQFVWPDLTIVNQVFKTNKWSGVACDGGDECTTHWVDVNNLPYENMWADDTTWFPDMLAGKFFHYKVVVENDRSVVVSPLPIEDVKEEA